MRTISELQTFFNHELRKELDTLAETNPKNLYIPIKYALDMGGKRLRPVMLLLTHGLFSNKIENAIPGAIAIEVFHNFTLLHDDIMDKAELRRNQATVYQKFNENVAILSGDAMSFISFQYLLKSTSNHLPEILKLFSKTAVEVCEGQQFDMDFEDQIDVKEGEYLRMIQLKTAVLLGCSLKTGALLANVKGKRADELYNLGINLGLAFQLQDDLLDTFGNENTFGKKIGGDIVANKKTYLAIKAMELADKNQKQELLSWMWGKDANAKEKIKAVTNIFNQLNIEEITQNKIDFYFDAASENIKKLRLSSEQKKQLRHLSEILLNRIN